MVNDWQREQQFQTLSDKRRERGVKVIRDGVEKIVDVKVRFCLFHIIFAHGSPLLRMSWLATWHCWNPVKLSLAIGSFSQAIMSNVTNHT